MKRTFNATGLCTPKRNYMVDISDRVEQIINEYVLPGKYFTMNRARQYGKTTTLYFLEERLKKCFLVLSLSFEAADEYFVSSETLVRGISMDIADCLRRQQVDEKLIREWEKPVYESFSMRDFGARITQLCKSCGKEVVLIIDEVDKSSDNQIFLSFLGLLRSKYLDQLKGKDQTFLSVILAGVYDIKNLKQKLHPGEESKYNSHWYVPIRAANRGRRPALRRRRTIMAGSPWNIAADFVVDMSFSAKDISSMLLQYEMDWDTGMDADNISQLLYDYTSGYPFLVSRLCQIMAQNVTEASPKEERAKAWSAEAFQEAVREFLKKSNTLFDDMVKKLADYPKLREMIYSILFQGSRYAYEPDNELIRVGEMFGFLKERDGKVCVSNRIFEMKLYNLFLSEEETDVKMFTAADTEKNQFIRGGHLQMELVLQKFCEYFEDIYGDADDRFVEDNGRRIFLIFLKPIINGSGNYYIETRTRNMKRTDVIIDYKGVQNVLEMKICAPGALSITAYEDGKCIGQVRTPRSARGEKRYD
ncbi:MAG: ATP-binding protein [Lachnospiraceae bacterium]|nr:ATP-binding protein [Lachnospiraceae bacterium]